MVYFGALNFKYFIFVENDFIEIASVGRENFHLVFGVSEPASFYFIVLFILEPGQGFSQFGQRNFLAFKNTSIGISL